MTTLSKPHGPLTLKQHQASLNTWNQPKYLALMVASLVLSVPALQLIGLSWVVSTLVIASIFVHELGHFWAFRWYKIPVKQIAFVPFLGAFVAPNGDDYDDYTPKQDIVVSLSGPIAGGLFSLIALAVGLLTHTQNIAIGAIVALILNAINLVPVLPMDGGHVAQYLSGRMERVSNLVFNLAFLVGGIALHSYFMIAIGAFELVRRALTYKSVAAKTEDTLLTTRGKWLAFAAWLATVVVLLAPVAGIVGKAFYNRSHPYRCTMDAKSTTMVQTCQRVSVKTLDPTIKARYASRLKERGTQQAIYGMAGYNVFMVGDKDSVISKNDIVK